MANLTLSIDDDLLKRARIRAIHEGTSVNAVARAHLSAYAESDSADDAAQRFLAIAADHPTTGSQGQRQWTRDEIYGERTEP